MKIGLVALILLCPLFAACSVGKEADYLYQYTDFVSFFRRLDYLAAEGSLIRPSLTWYWWDEMDSKRETYRCFESNQDFGVLRDLAESVEIREYVRSEYDGQTIGYRRPGTGEFQTRSVHEVYDLWFSLDSPWIQISTWDIRLSSGKVFTRDYDWGGSSKAFLDAFLSLKVRCQSTDYEGTGEMPF